MTHAGGASGGVPVVVPAGVPLTGAEPVVVPVVVLGGAVALSPAPSPPHA